MRSMPRLVRRNGIYYFRMAVPKSVVAALGRSELKATLRTSDLPIARKRVRRLSDIFEAFFRELGEMPVLAEQEIKRRIRTYMQECLDKGYETAQFLPSDTLVDVSAEVVGLREDIQRLRGQLASQSFEPDVVRTARALLVHSPSDPNSVAPDVLRRASEGVARAQMESFRILAARLEGRYDEIGIRDEFFAGLTTDTLPPMSGDGVNQSPASLTFEQLGDAYLAHATKTGMQPKTLGDVRRSLRFAYEVIGKSKLAADITTTDVRRLADVIGSVPPNFAKLNSKVSICEAAASNVNGPRLEAATQEKLFRLTKAAWKWAEANELIPRQPGPSVPLPASKKLSKKDLRQPYSPEKLKKIFTSPVFTGHESSNRRFKPGIELIRDGKFWIPWIGLYSGMRLGEIAQLLKSDVRREGSDWYFDVSKEEGDAKRIKTAASVRRVPIHQALLEAGLLSHVEKAAGKRIFEDISFGKDGYPSANFTKWWGRYGRALGFWSSKHTFHSFRHNFVQALKEAEVPKDIRRELVGHEGEDVHDNYGTSRSITQLKAAVDRVSYSVKPLPE